MTFAPLLPAWAILLATLFPLLAAFVVYRRPSVPAGLRLALLGGLVVILANPVHRLPTSASSQPVLAVVLDTSGSMNTTDGPAGVTRGHAARAAVQTILSEVRGWRSVVYGFNNQLQAPVPLTDGGDSDFAALAHLAEQTPQPTVAIVISDGADWAVSDPETALSAAGIVVHTVGVGTTKAGANSGVELLVPSPQLSPGQDIPLNAEITATPDLIGQETELIIEAVDDIEHPQELLRSTITLAGWMRVPVTVPAGESLGGRLWHARLAALPGESSTLDNSAWASAQVVDKTLRLLVLEGRPCWDTTFAVRAWRRDRQVQVSTAYLVGKKIWRTGEASTPPSVESLANVDVLVLGQAGGVLLPEATVLKNWVDGGGRLILLSTAATPVAGELDPLLPTAAPRTITISGGDSEGLLPAKATFSALAAPATIAPQARILLGTREQPLIALRRIGGGAVCRLNLDGYWRWHLSGGGNRELGERFCRQLLRSVSRTPAGELWAERLRVGVGDSAALWTRPEANVTSLLHTLPDGSTESIQLTDFGGRPRLTQVGCHRFSAGSRVVTIVVERRLDEQVAVARNNDRLARLAERTGGETHNISDVATLARSLTHRRALATGVVREQPLITERWWLLSLVALAGAEWWIRRRRHGLV